MDGLFSLVSCISTTPVFLDLRHCLFPHCVPVSQLGQAVPTDLLTTSCILKPAMCLCVGPHFCPAASVVYISLITFTKERKDQKKIVRDFKYLPFGGLVNQLGIQVFAFSHSLGLLWSFSECVTQSHWAVLCPPPSSLL